MTIYKGSAFVSDIVENVLELNPTSEDYTELGVECDRNVFHKCISRDRKYINYTCAVALRNLILKEISNDNSKIEYLYGYFKKYLSENTINQIEEKPDDFEAIINLAISEFLNPNDIKIGDFDSSVIIHPIIQDISDIYIRIAKYLRSDTKIVFLLIKNIIEQILDSIVEHEDISCIIAATGIDKKISTFSFKKVIPEDVIYQIKQFITLFKENDMKKVQNYNYKDGHGEVYCGTVIELLDRRFLNDFDTLKSLYKSKFNR